MVVLVRLLTAAVAKDVTHFKYIDSFENKAVCVFIGSNYLQVNRAQYGPQCHCAKPNKLDPPLALVGAEIAYRKAQ